MNNSSFSAYPAEGETVLMEGCKVVPLSIERKVLINNEYESFKPYNGKSITIIYLMTL